MGTAAAVALLFLNISPEKAELNNLKSNSFIINTKLGAHKQCDNLN